MMILAGAFAAIHGGFRWIWDGDPPGGSATFIRSLAALLVCLVCMRIGLGVLKGHLLGPAAGEDGGKKRENQ